MEDAKIDAPVGYQILDRFPVTSAFKEVFVATRSTALGSSKVVLKRYQSISQPEMQRIMERFHFRDEVEILSRDSLTYWAGPLRHPNLVPCDIVQNENGEVFLVEPLLDVTFDKHPALSPAEVQRWLRGFLQGLDYLHSQGYVHSDVKPANMGLLHGVPVLFDFGITSQLAHIGPGKTDPGSIRTRPPELFGPNVRPTAASDVWSLGASFYSLSTKGQFPFVTVDEDLNMPPPGSESRRTFEEQVAKRAAAAAMDEEAFLAAIERTLLANGIDDVFGYPTLVRTCLRLDPTRRPSATQLLWHIRFFDDEAVP